MPSNAEQTLAAQLEQAGIPFEREYRFDLTRKWKADFAIVDERHQVIDLLVEIEGGVGGVSRHLTYTGFTHDCEKYAVAAIHGFRLIRCTSKQVENGICYGWIRQALGLAVAA